MRFLQKLIIPVLVAAIIFFIYSVYFGKEKTLGNFSDFDTNNNANKEIRVALVPDKGISTDQAAGSAMFFGRDAKGIEYPVQVPLPLPDGFEKMKSVLLKGHLHKDHFHAVEIVKQ